MAVPTVTRANGAEAIQITAYGAVAVLSNSASGILSIFWIENKTANLAAYTTVATPHITIFYDRVNDALDLNQVALSVNSLYDAPVYIDDITNTDSAASMLILPKTVGDLDAIYDKYNPA